MLSESSQRLAEELHRIEQVLLGAVTTPQLTQSSIDGGELTVADEHGTPVGGVRADSTGAVVVEPDVLPDPPRVPAAPTVVGDANILRVAWSGGWAGDGSPDVSFRDEFGQLIDVGVEDRSEDVSSAGAQSAVTIEVHAATSPDGLGEPGTVVATMPALEGGNSTVCGPFGEAGDYFVALVARDRFNQRSGLSPVVEASVPLGRVSDELMDAYIRADEAMMTADGKSRVVHGADPDALAPEGGFRDGDLWFDTSPEGKNAPHVYSAEAGKFIPVADSRIADLESAVENVDFSGPLSEARGEWLAEAARDAEAKAKALADEAEAAASRHAEALAEGISEYSIQTAKEQSEMAAAAAKNAAVEEAIAQARVLANGARGEAIEAALAADKKISSQVAGLESDLSVVRESADGKSKITWSPGKATGKGNAGDTWFQTSGNRIVGHWRYDGNKWVEMSLDATVIPNLDAGKITSGFIDSARIQAGSVTADKLLIRPGNLFGDPSFQSDAWSGSDMPRFADGGYGDGPRLHIPAGNSQRGSYYSLSQPSERAVLEPDKLYRISAWVRGDREIPAGGAMIYARLYAANDPKWSWANPLRVENPDAIPPDAWHRVEGIVEVPEGERVQLALGFYARTGYYGTLDWSLPQVVPVTDETLIADGAITTWKISAGAVGTTALAADSVDAGKIQAEAVGAKQLAARSITADKIETGTITAESGVIGSLDLGKATVGELDGRRIAANTISSEQIAAQAIHGVSLAADAIDGKTITGATVRTSAGFPRVQMDKAGLHAWDEGGRKTFDTDQGTGAVSIVGEFTSGQAGQPRVKIDPDDWASIVGTDADGNLVNMNGAGIAIEGAAGRSMSIYHGGYTAPDGGHRGGAAAIDGPGRQHLRMTDNGDTWIRQLHAESFAKSELYLRPNRCRLSAWGNTGGMGAEAVVEVDTAGLTTWTLDGKALAEVAAGRGRAWMKGPSWGASGRVEVARSVDMSGDRTNISSNSANMGSRTYTGTAENWGVRYYKGSDHFGEIGSPGDAASTEFGVKAVDRHLALVADKSIVFNSRAKDGGFRFLNHLTTGAAPNVYMTGSGWIYRQTSARKYKDDIRRLDTRIDSFDDKLLSLRLVDWDDRANIERWEAYQEYLAEGGDPDEYPHPFERPRRIPGMIADEVHEAGLRPFVMYDEEGEVESLAYDRLGVALIPVVARLRDRISQLEDQVAGQAERLEALEVSLAA